MTCGVDGHLFVSSSSSPFSFFETRHVAGPEGFLFGVPPTIVGGAVVVVFWLLLLVCEKDVADEFFLVPVRVSESASRFWFWVPCCCWWSK